MNHFKRGLFLGIFLLFLTFVWAQEIPSVSTPGSDLLGEINTETGRPANLEKFQEYGDYYVNQEQNKTFLYQEWTNLLANNPVIGPILFYTDQFFSFFNPLWNVIFGFDFSWSWSFFVGLFLWFTIAFVIYFPAKEMLNNKLFGLVTGFIVATLTGFYGVLKTAITFFVPFIKNIFLLIILIAIVILLGYLYEQLFKKLHKESDEEKLKRAREAIKSEGDVAQRALDEFSDGGGI